MAAWLRAWRTAPVPAPARPSPGRPAPPAAGGAGREMVGVLASMALSALERG